MSGIDLIAIPTPGWWADAACHGRTELFYSTDKTSQAIALRICAGCPVSRECLDDALKTEPIGRPRFGVRGGTPAKRREDLARRMRTA